MTQYMLSVHSPSVDDGPGVPDAAPEPMTEAQMKHSMAQIDTLEAEMTSAGALVLSARLTEPDTATVVRISDGAVLITDGPYVESKEHLGGFYLIEADDLDTALSWASKTTAIIGMPIEVRALWSSRPA